MRIPYFGSRTIYCGDCKDVMAHLTRVLTLTSTRILALPFGEIKVE